MQMSSMPTMKQMSIIDLRYVNSHDEHETKICAFDKRFEFIYSERKAMGGGGANGYFFFEESTVPLFYSTYLVEHKLHFKYAYIQHFSVCS